MAQSARPSPEKKPTKLFARASRANDEQGNGHPMPAENQPQPPDAPKVKAAPTLVAKKFEPKHAATKDAPAEEKKFDRAKYRTHDAKELRELRPKTAAAAEETDPTTQNQKRRFAMRVQTAGLKMVSKPILDGVQAVEDVLHVLHRAAGCCIITDGSCRGARGAGDCGVCGRRYVFKA